MRSSFTGLFVFIFVTSPAAAQQNQPIPAGPLTLERVLELAEARSEALGIARSGVDRARGEQIRTRSGRFPQLNASASYDRALASEFANIFDSGNAGPVCPPFTLDPASPLDQRVAEIERAIDCGAVGSPFFGGDGDDGGALPFGRTNTWRVNLSFAQPVYTGGRQSAQEQLANVARQNAELAVGTARGQLLFDATRAFYDAALSDRLVRIAEATLAQAEATVRQVQATFEAGSQPEFELLRARVNRDNQRPVVIRQRAARDIAFLRLKQLLDLPPGTDLTLAAPLDDTAALPPAPFAARLVAEGPAAAPAAVAAERIAVREAAVVVQLREASLRLARSERMPSLSINSNYSRVAYPSGAFPTGDFRTNWTLGATVEVPVLTGGRQRGNEAVARAEVEQSRLQLRQVQELAALDSESALAELSAARAAFEASAGTVEQAARAYEIAEVRFRSGVSTQLELSDARLLLQQAEANRALTARDLQIARARVALLPELPLGAASGISIDNPQPAQQPQQQPPAQRQTQQPGAAFRGGVQ